MLTFKLDQETCIQCGECARACGFGVIVMGDDYPVIPDESRCIRCQHCLAVCPTASISIAGTDPANTMSLKDAWPSAQSMLALVKGRRSIRHFKPESLDAAVLDSLLNAALHAPSALNAEPVVFSVTRDAEVTEALRNAVYNALASYLADKDPAQDDVVMGFLRMASSLRQEHGADLIMRNAPHLLAASAPQDGFSPKEDCIIALSYLDLLAPALGAGTLWNGAMKICMDTCYPELTSVLGVPQDHTIGYFMSLGAPDIAYARTVQRTPKISYVTSVS